MHYHRNSSNSVIREPRNGWRRRPQRGHLPALPSYRRKDGRRTSRLRLPDRFDSVSAGRDRRRMFGRLGQRRHRWHRLRACWRGVVLRRARFRVRRGPWWSAPCHRALGHQLARAARRPLVRVLQRRPAARHRCARVLQRRLVSRRQYGRVPGRRLPWPSRANRSARPIRGRNEVGSRTSTSPAHASRHRRNSIRGPPIGTRPARPPTDFALHSRFRCAKSARPVMRSATRHSSRAPRDHFKPLHESSSWGDCLWK